MNPNDSNIGTPNNSEGALNLGSNSEPKPTTPSTQQPLSSQTPYQPVPADNGPVPNPNLSSAIQPEQSSSFQTNTQTPQTNFPQPQPSTSPAQTNQPVFGGQSYPPQQVTTTYGGNYAQLPNNKKKISLGKKQLVIIFVACLAVLGISGGYVFGFYIPNKPENVWNTGLDRSGEALVKLTDDAIQKERLEAIQKSEFTSNISVDAMGEQYSGSFSAKYDPTKANYNFTFSTSQNGDTEQQLVADVISNIKENNTYPDIFFRINGITKLGYGDYFPAIKKFEGKWISVDSDYIKSLVGDEDKKQEDLTAEDIAELTKAVTLTTSEYLLTSDENKAIIERKEFIAKEKLDGLTAYHYKAGINKSHAKDYCQALIQNISSTNAYKKLPGVKSDDIEKDRESATKECKDSVDQDIKNDFSFDIWIEAKYKLIHKVRFTEKGKDVYTEVGQIYTGGDDFTLFVNYHDGVNTVDGKLTLDINTNTSITKGKLEINGGEGDDKYSVSLNIEAKPFSGEINVDEPKGSIPIKDVLEELGLDNYVNTVESGGSIADDSERQTDINALHSQLEAYYAINGYYPSINNLNDSVWVETNLQGLSQEALRDPGGTDTKFSESTSDSSYAYIASGCLDNGEQCTTYRLIAKLDGGGTYEKNSLN